MCYIQCCFWDTGKFKVTGTLWSPTARIREVLLYVIFDYLQLLVIMFIVIRAANLVGLNVLQLMDENVAAALQYGVFRRSSFNATPQVRCQYQLWTSYFISYICRLLVIISCRNLLFNLTLLLSQYWNSPQFIKYLRTYKYIHPCIPNYW